MIKAYTGYKDYKRLLRRLQGLLEEGLGSQLVGLVLFGSVARGTAGEKSDIDMLVVFDGDRAKVQEIFVKTVIKLRRTHEYQDMAESGYFPDPFPIFMNLARLKTHPWILLDIADHGIIMLDKKKIIETEFARLKRRLRELGSKKVFLEDGTWYWDLKPDWKPGEIIEI
ncbi:MAG TPA: nucleotidyltransferase domain-containing protein [Candidatus Avalokitesvara rifleensis]|uniref:nucleotidyltransferase domain-containing protein n=1 Tax=Candidatus Avalokitesvara rifleensis TaxID=3367620 RepID=UPI002713950F|nr:nucleotidyltransferase domain-containing protein [Candidatus Brocadiales bacterium]